MRRTALLLIAAAVWLTPGCGDDHPASDSEPVDSGQPPLLTEITAEVGIRNDASWPDGTHFIPEIMGPGITLFDFDGDGDLDLLQPRVPPPGNAAAPAPNRLWEQRQDGTFVDATARSGLGHPGFGQAAAIADVDNDGDQDVYFANYGADAFYLNHGDGSFSDTTGDAGLGDELWSSAATFCDYDRDGFVDLYVAHYVHVDYDGPCRANSGAPEYCGPASFAGKGDRLWRNDGDGSFTDVTAEAGLILPDGGARAKGLGVVCLDLSGDGLADFYVANDGEANQLWINQGDGSFAEESVMRGVAVNRHGRAEASMGLAVGDLDRDGYWDLLSTHLALENNTIYFGGSPLFTDRTVEMGMAEHDLLLTGFGCAFLDIENDGDLDLAVVNGEVRGVLIESAGPVGAFWERYAEPNLLFENDGNGRFVNASKRAGAFASRVEVSRGLALGDLDRDGDLDLVLSNVDNTVRVFRNDAPTGENRWLQVRALTGKRDAIGARLTVVAGDERFTGAVLPGASYQSSSDPVVHFGLGRNEPEALDVLWPDGGEERFVVAGADRRITIRQGQGSSR